MSNKVIFFQVEMHCIMQIKSLNFMFLKISQIYKALNSSSGKFKSFGKYVKKKIFSVIFTLNGIFYNDILL